MCFLGALSTLDVCKLDVLDRRNTLIFALQNAVVDRKGYLGRRRNNNRIKSNDMRLIRHHALRSLLLHSNPTALLFRSFDTAVFGTEQKHTRIIALDNRFRFNLLR